jgi:hypothetical protein
MKLTKTYILLVIFVLMLNPAFSQQVSVEAKLDTSIMLVGDQTGFTLGLRLPENYFYTWPQLNDTLSANVEIVKKSAIDTLSIENGMMTIAQKLTITAFDSGYYVIPPVRFDYGAEGSETLTQIETEPYLLNVFSVEVDTTQTFKPIKGPIEAPYTFAEILPWLLLTLAILLIAGLAIYFLVRREKNVPLFSAKPKPKIAPHKVALDNLDKLNDQKVWQQGHIKIYHSRLTDIIRIYIEDSFEVRAVEMTTPEILKSIKRTQIIEKDIELLGEMLELADLVKFAKFKPQPSENEQAMNWAYDFVKNTMRLGDTGEKEEGV